MDFNLSQAVYGFPPKGKAKKERTVYLGKHKNLYKDL